MDIIKIKNNTNPYLIPDSIEKYNSFLIPPNLV